MSIITNYKLPENDEEIQANRVKFVKALLSESPESQCRGQLYLSPEEAQIRGEDAKEGQHRRCAIGLAGAVFFNVTNEDELDKFGDRDDAEHPYGFDLVDEVAKMLGIKYGGDPVAASVSSIIEANDDDEMSFAAIGTDLRKAWEIPSE